MNVEKIFEAVAGGPVTASVRAAGVVLTNPFREKRQSFKRHYARVRFNNNWTLEQEVRDCPDCKGNWGLMNKMYHAGDTNFDAPYRSEDRVYTEDSHCAKHWDAVREHQWWYHAIHAD